ncbi:MAG TPA: sulfatase, partial [Pirellulaceae bacterium]|nr:sulfatase [Pirellulaceae bacterium]
PNLDRMAAEGARFTCGYCSQPICSPSRAGLMTGRFPARLHITTFLPGRPDAKSQMVLHPKIEMQLPLAEKTIAEYLKEAGYATGCVGKWHLGGMGFGPKEQGFDFAFAGRANTEPSATEGGKGEYEHTAQALKFIDEHKEQPFFLYVPYNTPHIPLAAQEKLIAKHKDAFYPTYAAMMETMDDCVGLILKKLKDLGLDEKTLVIFTSDNGGLSVLEFAGGPSTHNTPYRGGKGYLYEGGLREPTIVRWPGQIRPAVIDAPIINLDLLPTLLSLAGVTIPTNLDGQNIAPLLLGTEENKELRSRTFYWHFPHYNNQGGRPAGALRDGDLKLVTYYDTGETQLFNLKDDPGETKDLAPQQSPLAKGLKATHDAWLDLIGAQRNVPNPEFDPALFKKLYQDFDPSRPILRKTTVEMEQDMKTWRQLMNEVVAGARGKNKKK